MINFIWSTENRVQSTTTIQRLKHLTPHRVIHDTLYANNNTTIPHGIVLCTNDNTPTPHGVVLCTLYSVL